ncbi:MAG: tagatose 1,6-diphosphate aldolase [Chloroflexota bacterium]|nr:tagatose 1,6-diphosphate aldolase [Chloroflexota bacterium]
MRELTIGKTRGLQQLSNTKGIFTICSVDHRRSLRKMMGNGNVSSITYQHLVDFKLDICEALASHASGVLLDPIYGASQAIAANVIPGQTGLLVSLEAADCDSYGDEGQSCELLTEWSIGKVKAMGASAVKLPLYYRPDLPNVASEHLNAVIKSAYDCKSLDLAIFVGPRNYIVKELERDPWEFARKKSTLAVDTAYQLSRLPVDVLKVEFPADVAYERDEQKMLDMCHQLNEASVVPWVLLSGGVGFDVFKKQLEIACKAGASGFLAGRALWQEAASLPSRLRFKFLESTAVERLQELSDMADAYGKSWYHKLEASNNYLYPDFNEEWSQNILTQKLLPNEKTADLVDRTLPS